MPYSNETELLDAIFRLFPKASIVSKTELKPFKESKDTTTMNPARAKRAKPRPAVLLAYTQKVFDSRQLSLFDDEIKRGGI